MRKSVLFFCAIFFSFSLQAENYCVHLQMPEGWLKKDESSFTIQDSHFEQDLYVHELGLVNHQARCRIYSYSTTPPSGFKIHENFQEAPSISYAFPSVEQWKTSKIVEDNRTFYTGMSYLYLDNFYCIVTITDQKDESSLMENAQKMIDAIKFVPIN